ncbi:hypothetical protein DEO72_LG6g1206 [Vigna unguiculata]|uniref:Uncharacterized protein n=1 Tax=Vigna unguiculata TaxID=3917 RepID=A0A4D6M5D4_VIGUN|nr:hypothetical protein DEO72_LG6g1206 [Vigna unguiculata]
MHLTSFHTITRSQGRKEEDISVRGGCAELRDLLQWCGVPPRGGRKRGEDGDALVARALQRFVVVVRAASCCAVDGGGTRALVAGEVSCGRDGGHRDSESTNLHQFASSNTASSHHFIPTVQAALTQICTKRDHREASTLRSTSTFAEKCI